MGGCYEASLSQDEEMMGIIPRILKDLFKGIQERPDCDFKVRVSYLEVTEKIYKLPLIITGNLK